MHKLVGVLDKCDKSRRPIKPSNNDHKDKRDKPLGTTPDAGNKNDNAV